MSNQLPDFVNEEDLFELIELALREDVGTGDVTSNATIQRSTTATAVFSAKENGIVAGIELANIIFKLVDSRLRVDWEVSDGDLVKRKQTLGSVRGNARYILLAERIVLNFMQRMSGIATATYRMVEQVQEFDTEILDTRKTVPGLRALDKWAVRIGGGKNHRFGLHDMILIKDNHIAASGGTTQALSSATAYCKSKRRQLTIEIEAKTLDQVREIVASGLADVIMLDNMAIIGESGALDTSMLSEALTIIGSDCKTEASGNVTVHTVKEIASTGVGSISSGALTHSVAALDISLNVTLDV